MGFLMNELGLSERRSCRIVGLSRSVQQYRPAPKNDAAVVGRLKELASENRRYGYLRLHAMLRREGLVANRKRTYRLYTEQGLQVRTKKRRKLPRRDRIAPQVPERPMQRWSLDFVSDQLADCRRFRVLNIVDDHSRFCPGQIVDVSISGARVARYLDDLLSTAEEKPATGRRDILPARGSGTDAGTARAPWHARSPNSWRVPRRVGLKGQPGCPTSGAGWGFSRTALGEPVAVAIHLEDGDVVTAWVEQRTREALGAEGLGPLVERLTHHVTILEMNGDSYRLAQSRTRKTPASA